MLLNSVRCFPKNDCEARLSLYRIYTYANDGLVELILSLFLLVLRRESNEKMAKMTYIIVRYVL